MQRSLPVRVLTKILLLLERSVAFHWMRRHHLQASFAVYSPHVFSCLFTENLNSLHSWSCSFVLLVARCFSFKSSSLLPLGFFLRSLFCTLCFFVPLYSAPFQPAVSFNLIAGSQEQSRVTAPGRTDGVMVSGGCSSITCSWRQRGRSLAVLLCTWARHE